VGDELARYRAILKRDKRYDGKFYFAKTTGVYCRASCPALHPREQRYTFFDTVSQAKASGYRACMRCHPDALQTDLSLEILDKIDAGVINDSGVHGLADLLHISERHLRRVVHDATGTSPTNINQVRRLTAAKRLLVQTKLPIIDVAFRAGFSSLRQFNDVFKHAFSVSPGQLRKASRHSTKDTSTTLALGKLSGRLLGRVSLKQLSS